MRGTILITDDERLIRWSLAQRVRAAGFGSIEAADAQECLAQARNADAVILDYKLPDRDGFEVLRELRRSQPRLPVIMLTAHSSLEHAVDAIKLGAFQYAAKPFDGEKILAMIEAALEWRSPTGSSKSGARTANSLIGTSAAVVELRRMVERVAASPASTVLVTGESGTGKELVARAIHGESSRREEPFVHVTCSTIPEPLIEAELFGHEKGAFTDARTPHAGLIEQAHRGTLFLDEIGDMPLPMQAKLLRFLEARAFRRVGGTEERRPDVRIIAATNLDLEAAVKQGRFRVDLYYRLAVLRVRVPSLAERLEDLPLLARMFADELTKDTPNPARLGEPALQHLSARAWPGNVRELRNAIERALSLSEHDELGPEDFETAPSEVVPFALPVSGVNLEEVERALLIQALERSGGNQRLAGEMLGINRDQVRYRMAKYAIPSRRRRRTLPP